MSVLFAAIAYLFMVAAGVEIVDKTKTDLPEWVYRIAFIGVIPLVLAAAVSVLAFLVFVAPIAAGHVVGKKLRESWD